MIYDQEEIKSEAVNYFRQQLNGDHVSQGEELLQHIPRLITMAENDLLDQFPTIEEVHKVAEEMDGKSITGPDA